MLKKFFIIFILIISFGVIGINSSFAAEGEGTLRERCKDGGDKKINCPQFEIKAGDFSPGSKEILDKASEGNGDTVKTANAILGVIIKNLIVVFGVLSLLMMTIGGGMMIFHAGQESILTKGKSIFMYGIISLAVGLSAGIIVQAISYFLY